MKAAIGNKSLEGIYAKSLSGIDSKEPVTLLPTEKVYQAVEDGQEYFLYHNQMQNIRIKNAWSEPASVHVTEAIELKDADWFQLEVEDYAPENTSIEYSVLDGRHEWPILPNGQTFVRNEKLFPHLPLRFSQSSNEIEVKKDGQTVESNYESAKKQEDGIYTVSYYTEQAFLKPISNKIQIKIILRSYTESAEQPYVKEIKIRLTSRK